MKISIDDVKVFEKTKSTPEMLKVILNRVEAIKLSTAFNIPISSCTDFFITNNNDGISRERFNSLALMPIYKKPGSTKQSGYKRYLFNASFELDFETILDITDMIAEA